MEQSEKGYLHAPCGRYFKYYDARMGRANVDSYLDHRCESLTPERVRNWRAWEIHDLIAEINQRAAELKNGSFDYAQEAT